MKYTRAPAPTVEISFMNLIILVPDVIDNNEDIDLTTRAIGTDAIMDFTIIDSIFLYSISRFLFFKR